MATLQAEALAMHDNGRAEHGGDVMMIEANNQEEENDDDATEENR